MRSHIAASVLAFSLALTGGALAQPQQHTPTPQEMAAHEQSVEAAAQAQAVQPGDDQLSCDQLQQQMMAAVNDPTVQHSIQANGAMAMQQQAQAQQALREHQQHAAPNFIGNMISGFLPGGAAAQTAAAAAQAQHDAAQAQQNQQQMAQMQQNNDTAMPQMMRGQHLYQLAQQKHCAFATQQNGGH